MSETCVSAIHIATHQEPIVDSQIRDAIPQEIVDICASSLSIPFSVIGRMAVDNVRKGRVIGGVGEDAIRSQ